MIPRDYLIVGAGIAGVSACEGIREHDKKGTIMLVGNDRALPYQRPQLFHSVFGKNAAPLEKILAHDAAWFTKNNIDVRLDTMVTQVNVERHLAVLSNGQAVEFRKGCMAMGSRARRPQVAGTSLGNVIYLRSARDVLALREMAEYDRQIVIIGGGHIAMEIAATLSQVPKIQLTMMHRGAHLWGRIVDAETGAWLTEQFASKGIKMLMGQTLNGFEGRTVLKNVQTKSGDRIPAGLAIVALGIEPNLGLVTNTPLGYAGGTPVNEYLETDEKGIFSVGDLALYPCRIFGGVRRVQFWDGAITQGRVAGANMTGKKRIKFDYMPAHTSQLFDLKFDLIGDFSKPPTRTEIEGDRAKKKFIIRNYQLTALSGILLCNQSDERIEQAKEEVRSAPRQIKRVIL
jgi:3-phenylpropionate/trans-cinnamate dioxygenase ferredoxin reductase subunit